jgi:PhnB protein
MSKKVSPIPEGLHSLTPYLVLPGCAKAIEFYKQAFRAEETMRMDAPGGQIGHAELRIGDSVLYCADAHPPQHPATTAMLCLYVEDCDAVFARAVEAGAKVVLPLEDKFYGDRAGMIADAFGQQWSIATHKEDLSPEELTERAKKAMPH